jgi:hypothetical protein
LSVVCSAFIEICSSVQFVCCRGIVLRQFVVGLIQPNIWVLATPFNFIDGCFVLGLGMIFRH